MELRFPREFLGTERFQVLRRIGEGGMGVVFEAVDRERNARIALKTLRELDSDSLFRLKKEFRALHDVRHSNLVSLGELLEENGQWFFTMELIEGVDFLTYVREGDLSPDLSMATTSSAPGTKRRSGAHPEQGDSEASNGRSSCNEARLRSALGQLTRGLMALHDAGKVHRDVKPSNMLVTRDDRVVLLDFGLVTGHADAHRSVESRVVGTIYYMAPEQAASKPVGPEADWYSVGVVLYEALTGELPYRGTSLEVMMNKQHVEPVAPRTIAPGAPADLDQLCMALLRIDPKARPRAGQILSCLGLATSEGPGVRSPQPRDSLPMVGRKRELGILASALEQARQGKAVGVLVVGESGIGKTTLVRSFIEELAVQAPQILSLMGRCYESESVPYKAIDDIIDALSRYLMRRPDAEVRSILPRQAGLIGEVFPVMRRVKAVAQARLPVAENGVDPQQARTRLFGTLRELFARLADSHPLVVVVDDFQWTDSDSLALLGEILRPPESPALLLIATIRSEAAKPEELDLLKGALGAPAEWQTLKMDRLSPEDSEELASKLLVEASAGETATPEAIAREADGHPLFIEELARNSTLQDGQAPIAVRLTEAIQARIESLSPSARELLELVAVAGAPTPQELIRRASELDVSEFARLVADLRAGRLLRTAGARGSDPMELYHNRIRDPLLACLTEEVRSRRHRELALALEGSPYASPEALAVHWWGAGEPDRTARYLIEAAENAEKVLAFDHAAGHYQAALDLRLVESRAREVRVRLAGTLVNAGRAAEAADIFLSAVPGAGAAEALELKRRAAEQYLQSGHIDEGLNTIRNVLGEAGLALPATPRRALLSLLLRRAQLRLRGLGFRERRPSQISLEELIRIDICWSIGSGLGVVDNVLGAYFSSRGLLMALRAGDPFRLARALAHEALFLATLGTRSEARVEKLAGKALALAAKVPQPEARAWALVPAGFLAYQRGQWRQALDRMDEVERVIRERCTGMRWELCSTQLFAIHALYYLGELSELARRVSLLLREAEDRGDLYAITNLKTGQPAITWLMRDEPRVGQEHAAEAVRRWSRRGFHLQHYYGLMAEAQADLYLDEGNAALEKVTSRWESIAGALLLHIQRIRIEAFSLRARCALARARAEPQGRAECLQMARRDARLLRSEREPWAKALAQLVDAGMAQVQGDLDRSVRILERAVGVLDSIGMTFHAMATRRRLGELLGGSDGNALVSRSDEWMTSQQVLDPACMTRVLMPGF
ncbi:MAG: protein kinase [Deltaproteobacteria bacterium]|nr:protein kinase [Deltaproteobacteria bacterium]